jgi:predicted dehydrogenase
MASPLRCGIIGCGVIAPTHAESFRLQEDIEIKWACDVVEHKAREFAETYGIPNVTADYQEVMDDSEVDCVSICTPHASHSPIAVAALDGGKHVLCEKALGATRQGMDAMFRAHEHHSDLVFSGVFQHRFDGINRLLRRLVEEGAFGTVLTAGVQMRCLRTNDYYHGDEWRGTWDQEGGSVLINQAIHFIDSLLWIMGGARQVCGAHKNITHQGVIETEDCAVASLRFRCGALGTLEATASSHLDWEPTISVHGTEGSLDLRHGEPVKLVFDDPAREEKVRAEIAQAADSEGVEAGKDYYGTGHAAQIADFVAAIREGREPFVPAMDARHAVDVVLGIYASHRHGEWVEC